MLRKDLLADALAAVMNNDGVLSIRGDSYRLRERKKARGADDLLCNPQSKETSSKP